MDNRNLRSDEITPEIIKRWKAQHPKGVYQLDVSAFRCFVRMPTDWDMMKYCTLTKKQDPRELGKGFLKTIWLGGDLEILSNDMLFDQTAPHLEAIIRTKNEQALKGIKI